VFELTNPSVAARAQQAPNRAGIGAMVNVKTLAFAAGDSSLANSAPAILGGAHGVVCTGSKPKTALKCGIFFLGWVPAVPVKVVAPMAFGKRFVVLAHFGYAAGLAHSLHTVMCGAVGVVVGAGLDFLAARALFMSGSVKRVFGHKLNLRCSFGLAG
jgi:hypothetical protein